MSNRGYEQVCEPGKCSVGSAVSMYQAYKSSPTCPTGMLTPVEEPQLSLQRKEQ